MPRTGMETLVYAALACTAGISEEFLYRGFVFMAFREDDREFRRRRMRVRRSYRLAWFSLAHVYQGRRGIITTFVVGMIFVSIRIWTGSLIPAVAAHIGIDLVVGIGAAKFLRKV